MTTPVSPPAEVASAAVAGSTAPPATLDPRDVKFFAALMAPGTPATVPTAAMSPAALAIAAQLRDLRSVDEIRKSMLESIDPSDPVLTMWQLTDASAEMQAAFQKMHVATGLASAATGMVGLLLKNQQ